MDKYIVSDKMARAAKGRWALVLLAVARLSAVAAFELSFQDPQCYKNYIGPGSARDEEGPACSGEARDLWVPRL
jgi:hypothetical protein